MYLIKYFFYVLKHKWYVYKFGRKLGLGRWYLLKHDMSKFSGAEFKPYAVRFYKYKGVDKKDLSAEVLADFNLAVNHHIDNNAHHYNSALNKNLEQVGDDFFIIIMNETLVKEMVADWLAMEWFYSEGKSIDMSSFITSRIKDFKTLSSSTLTMFIFYLNQTGQFNHYDVTGEEYFWFNEEVAETFLSKNYKYTPWRSSHHELTDS